MTDERQTDEPDEPEPQRLAFDPPLRFDPLVEHSTAAAWRVHERYAYRAVRPADFVRLSGIA